jgi:GNAT superfamily N-acetyltransferase
MPAVELKHFKNNHFDIMLNSTIIGNICVLDYGEMCFIEDFKIYEQYQNKRFGTLTLNKLKEKYDTIALISEERAVGFYLKNEFIKINCYMVYDITSNK